jgi:UDP-N-acetylmuramoyl-L-alanyl-D-glutamate--2,6-diaminopimelate ligase
MIQSDQRIRLRDILPDAQIVGADEIFFESCCGDWRDCQQNDLFVALIGAEQDGHEYTGEAIRRGAGAIVTERLMMSGRPQCIVSDTREAYGRICQALAGQPARRLSTIGVSGSDGKTVTSHLIRNVLIEGGRETGLVSSLEVNFGSGQKETPNSKINSAQLAQHLTQMALGNCQAAVVELPSTALAQRSNAGVELDIAVLTNIRSSDLDFHGNLQNYRRSQSRLLDQLKPDGMAILNADDPTSHFLLNKIKTPTLTFGMKQDANVTATLVRRNENEQTFLLMAGGESVPVRTQAIGDHYIQNCLAAAAVGLAMGLDLTCIATGLSRGPSVPGRMEQINCGQDFGVWVDAARTPNQLANALQTVKQVARGKVWALCSVDADQSQEIRRQLGEVVERSKVNVILSKTGPSETIDYEPIHQVLDGFDQPGAARIIPNRFKAIEWVLENAQDGDAVLITGCGERPFAEVGDGSWTIGDRDVCEAWLYDNASLDPIDSGDGLEPGIYNIDNYRDC